MRFGVVVFPGSNCDQDALHVVHDVLREPVRAIWHKDRAPLDVDCVILPGGFSYGDYLRAGAIARFSPVMDEVIAHVKRGGKLLAICNGFQIALEAGLLPGAMLRNRGLRFVCRDVTLRNERDDTPFSCGIAKGALLTLPIAHAEGNWTADEETVARVEGEGLVALRYCDASGAVTDAANPNGSRNGIAGLYSPNRNVLGLMPHPERMAESILGGLDGRRIFESLLGS